MASKYGTIIRVLILGYKNFQTFLDAMGFL
jgi:hypothetical protein